MAESAEGMVSLAEAIDALRSDLLRAWGGGGVRPLRFKPAPVELTLQVAVTAGNKGSAGVKWWVVNAGGEKTRETVVTQTIKLVLDPVGLTPAGEETEFLISDEELPRVPSVDEQTLNDFE
ncbi:trypco2 family protein [Streptomyces sp. NPDC017936]|uniref:trypco2 family protein n=1 Tax=Streptomyces sp. NPDC017936 TaxID=3365016 RepID=UPI00379CAEC5